MKNTVFKSNRHNLINEVEDNSIIILFAGNAPTKSADEKYQFTPNRNFYYFTGINEENHILLLKKINNVVEEILFIKEIDEEKERWVGKSIRPDEAKEISGILDVRFLGELDCVLNKLFNNFDEYSC